jgi:hypothetical protein
MLLIMDGAWISGILTTAGIVIGWSLNQVGVRLGERAERRRTEIRDADERVFAAAQAATRFGEGIRWLVQIDEGKEIAGQGPSHAAYEQVVVEAQTELRNLRQSLMVITIKGPKPAAPDLGRIVTQAQQLRDTMIVTTRREIGAHPDPLLHDSDTLVAAAQSWAEQYSSPSVTAPAKSH